MSVVIKSEMQVLFILADEAVRIVEMSTFVYGVLYQYTLVWPGLHSVQANP